MSVQGLVEDMVHGLEHNSHILYIDNYYTSVNLLRSLRNRGIRCTGAIRKNRIYDKKLVSEFSNKRTAKGTVKAYSNE